MLTFDQAFSLFSISFLLALSPGPDNIFVLTQSAVWGRRSGLLVVLGLCTGLIGHTVAVAVGLAAVFASSATAFNVLKWAGAAYLVYLAWGAWRAGAVTSRPRQGTPAMSDGQLYRRGIVMNLTNPKVSIFFLAFLPQFTNPAQGSVALQILSLGALIILSTLIVFSLIAWFAGLLGDRLQESARAQIWLNRIAGTVFLGLAIRLALSERT